MKKFYVASVIVTIVVAFSYCKTAKKAASKPVLFTYETNVKPLVLSSCAPCHVPGKGGNKKPLDNYESAKATIDDVVHRIGLNPAEKGFMPFRKEKLSDSAIAVFNKWKADGLLEK